MANTLAGIFVVAVVVGWVVAFMATLYQAIERWDDEPRRATIWAFITALIVIIPFGVLIGQSNSQHANDLCLRGHEEWRSTGKSYYKAWVCEQWQER